MLLIISKNIFKWIKKKKNKYYLYILFYLNYQLKNIYF